ncbi:hypothetical protein NKDENANG_03099 [Candidatus Entotheonellaceae bacterium PAL068K]
MQRGVKSIRYGLGALALALSISFQAWAASGQPTIITLTQTGCQFVEIEAADHGFQPQTAADCKAINRRTAKDRIAQADILELQPGKYVFRVTNKNVPYELGFYLRGAGLGRLTLPKVSGGGLHPGDTKDYEVDLKEGEYVYSCPLNPTPNYRLMVKQ